MRRKEEGERRGREREEREVEERVIMSKRPEPLLRIEISKEERENESERGKIELK